MVQGVGASVQNTYSGLAEFRRRSIRTATCLTPPRAGSCVANHPTERKRNQTARDEGPLTLDRSRTVDEEILGKVIHSSITTNDPKKSATSRFFVWYNPARMAHHDRAAPNTRP